MAYSDTGYNPGGRRDPFVPLIGVSESSFKGLEGILTVEDVVLQGIVIGPGGKKCAIINGEVLEEGQGVERLKVESIGENTVKIRLDDDEYELVLYGKEGGE